MNRRYFIRLSFDGAAYHGWQIQPNGNSLQNELQGALSTLLRQDVGVVGAGRTDAGVHARLMVAHFDFNSEQSLDCSQLTYKLNSLLPSDMSVSAIYEVDADMHARFSAKWRTYHYYIHTRKDPFLRRFSYEIRFNLDFDAMNEAAKQLIGEQDFRAFCKSHTDVKTTLCNVVDAQWVKSGDYEWYFCITANRFLRNMVRAITGTLIDVGRSRISISDVSEIIKGRNRSDAGESLPAHALFLEDIQY